MTIVNSTYNLVATHAAYELETPKFLKLLQDLYSDYLLSTLDTDTHYSDLFDDSYNPSDLSIFLPLYVNIANNISSSLNVLIYPKTLDRVRCYLKLVTVFQSLNEIADLKDTLDIFVVASNTTSILHDSNIIFSSSDILKDLFKLSVNNSASDNVSAALPRLYEYSKDLNSSSISSLITALVSTGNYYSNEYIESFLEDTIIKLIAQLEIVLAIIEELSECPCNREFCLKLSEILSTLLNSLYSTLSNVINIAIRLNYNVSLIESLRSAISLVESVFSVFNILLIINNIGKIDYTDVNIDSVNSALTRVNDTLFSNSSIPEADLILQQLLYSTNDIGTSNLVNEVSEAVHKVVYGLKPGSISHPAVVSSLNKLLVASDGKIGYLEYKNTQVAAAIVSIESSKTSITSYIKTNSHLSSIGFLAALSLILKNLEGLLELLNKFICSLCSLLCSLKKLVLGGINSIIDMIKSGFNLAQKANTAVASSMENIKTNILPKVESVVSDFVAGKLTISKDANIAAIRASLGDVVAGKVLASYNSLNISNLVTSINIKSKIDEYTTSALTLATTTAKSILDPKSCAASSISFKLPGITFPSISTPKINFSFPRFTKKPFKC